MTEEDAKKAIEEYAEAASGASGAPASHQLIADALVIVENAMANPGKAVMEPSKPPWRFNTELHRVEMAIDERLAAIRRTQEFLTRAVNAVAQVLLDKALKEAMK